MLNYSIKAKILFILAMNILAIGAVGQEVSDNEEITVVAPYQPTVSEAIKINVSPRIPDEELNKPDFIYDILSKDYKAPPLLEPIVAAKIEGESVTKLYRNYVRAGFGNYGTPYIEFFANKLRSKKNAFGVHLKHISSSGKIKEYGYPGNSLTDVSAYGKKFMSQHTLTSKVFFNRKGVHYYGYRPEEFPALALNKKDIKQTYNHVGFTTNFASNYPGDKKLNHTLGVGYSYLSDRYDASEHNILFNADLDYSTRFFDFSDKEKLGLDLGINYFLNSDSITDHNSGIISISPYYSLAFDQYLFRVGVNTMIESDSNSTVHVYPVIRAEVKVIEDYLITFAGISGGLKKNSLRLLSDENPFIISTLDKRFSNTKISQYGGLKGKLSKYLDYNVSFRNSTVENMPFFVNDTVSALGDGLNNQFAVVYDRVKHTRLKAEFGFHYINKFNIILRGQYNDYFLDNEDQAWHKPKLEIALAADYSMQDKILIRGEVFTRSKMYAKLYEIDDNTGDIVVKAEELDAMIDVNLGLEYRYSKVLSGFLNLNNVLGQRYEHWYNYPSYRFNFLLGVSYSF